LRQIHASVFQSTAGEFPGLCKAKTFDITKHAQTLIYTGAGPVKLKL
jgi:hypothetical protein